jgi:uncharacterized membrane protein YdjX (TVP38/TMEM64 family)
MARERASAAVKEYGTLAIVAVVLVASVLLVRAHSAELTRFVEQRPIVGGFVYFALNVLDAVLAPGLTLPLIPVVSRAWGHIPAALVTTAGWTMGSLAAFLIARRWGYPLVRKLTSIERVKRMKRYIPQDLFWSVVLLRMVMPMDVMSYALGLFTDMKWSRYAVATALGVAPAAFVLAYLGRLTHAYELIVFGIAGVAIAWLVLSLRRRGPALRGFRHPHPVRR